jgi:hypothetical protein
MAGVVKVAFYIFVTYLAIRFMGGCGHWVEQTDHQNRQNGQGVSMVTGKVPVPSTGIIRI